MNPAGTPRVIHVDFWWILRIHVDTSNFHVVSAWKYPRGKFPCVFRVIISTYCPRGNIPRGFHMEISTRKISTCILRGSIHVENFHVYST